jgi:hypothetical protein
LNLLSLVRGTAGIVLPSSSDAEAEEPRLKCDRRGHRGVSPVSSFEFVIDSTAQSAAISAAVPGNELDERKESGGQMAADPFSASIQQPAHRVLSKGPFRCTGIGAQPKEL